MSVEITWLQLLRLVRISWQFINQWEGKPKSIVTSTHNFSCALSKLHGIARNLDWLIALSAPAVIGRGNYFGICFTTLNWKLLYDTTQS